MLDDIDRKLMDHLQGAGRESWADLQESLGLTAAAVGVRARKLEEEGVIRGYAALLHGPALGFPLTAFVAVTLDRPRHRAAFLRKVEALPEIQECHHVAGEDDYLLKIRGRDTADLDRVVSEEIKGVAGVVRTRTTIVLSSPKESVRWPIAPAARRKARP